MGSKTKMILRNEKGAYLVKEPKTGKNRPLAELAEKELLAREGLLAGHEEHEEDLKKLAGLNPGMMGRVEHPEKMYTRLKGQLSAAQFWQSLRALKHAREYHLYQSREGSGTPYVVHPLRMACRLMAEWTGPGDPNIDDTLIAATLLHDVKEDIGVSLRDLGYSEEVCRVIDLVTIVVRSGETKFEAKIRYYDDLFRDKWATILKLVDKEDSLTTMMIDFAETPDRCRKNVVEFDMVFLPGVRRVRDEWPEATNLIQRLTWSITKWVDCMAICYKVLRVDADFVNAPGAKDYTYLLTGEEPPKALREESSGGVEVEK